MFSLCVTRTTISYANCTSFRSGYYGDIANTSDPFHAKHLHILHSLISLHIAYQCAKRLQFCDSFETWLVSQDSKSSRFWRDPLNCQSSSAEKSKNREYNEMVAILTLFLIKNLQWNKKYLSCQLQGYECTKALEQNM